jgi:3-hydroxyisobutyrate dehydrogenase-like beta-hydroxyacid dehydrogenase
MKIGFIGTGAMGRPMLRNLVAKGFGVIAFDRAPAALAAAVESGASGAASCAAVAAGSELVVTMLPSSSHVEAAYLGAGGILEGIAAGRLCADMSTIDPATSQRVAARLRERGVRFMGLVVDAARSLRIPVTVSSAAQQILRLASSHGYGRKDVSSVYAFLAASSADAPV